MRSGADVDLRQLHEFGIEVLILDVARRLVVAGRLLSDEPQHPFSEGLQPTRLDKRTQHVSIGQLLLYLQILLALDALFRQCVPARSFEQ